MRYQQERLSEEIDWAVTILMATKPARQLLAARADALIKLRALLEQEEPARVEALFRHL